MTAGYIGRVAHYQYNYIFVVIWLLYADACFPQPGPLCKHLAAISNRAWWSIKQRTFQSPLELQTNINSTYRHMKLLCKSHTATNCPVSFTYFTQSLSFFVISCGILWNYILHRVCHYHYRCHYHLHNNCHWHRKLLTIVCRSRRVNTLRPGKNYRHALDDIFKCILMSANIWISIKISLKFVPKGLINNVLPLVQIRDWRQIIVWTIGGPVYCRI